MICKDCGGIGFKEYDAGLLQIGCKVCSGAGKVDEALTKEEFEKAYAFRSDMTVDQVREMGLEAAPSDCVEGWAMQKMVVEPVLTKEILQKAKDMPAPLTVEDLLVIHKDSYIPPESVESIELPPELAEEEGTYASEHTPEEARRLENIAKSKAIIEGKDDSDSGTKQPDTTTVKPTKPKKRKRKPKKV